jgi:hypothetical protein
VKRAGKDRRMKRITKWEWHGNGLLLLVLSVSVVLIPFAVVYFITNLVMIEHEEPDPESG